MSEERRPSSLVDTFRKLGAHMNFTIEAYEGPVRRGATNWTGDYHSAIEEAARYFCDESVTRVAVRRADGELLFSCLNPLQMA